MIMQISILLPTRGRVEAVKKSVLSIINHSIEPENIEILYRIDDDDEDTLSHVEELKTLHTHTQILIAPRYEGYQSLHIFTNELCAISTGKWLWLWNDDAKVMTKGWDLIFDDLKAQQREPALIQIGEKKMYSPESQNLFVSPFPIINRKVYEKLGHFSASYYNDTYQGLVVLIAEQMCGAYRNLNGIPPQINLSSYYSNLSWQPNFNTPTHNLISYNAMSEIMTEHLRADITGDNNDNTWQEGVTKARREEDSTEHMKSLWPQIIKDALAVTELYIQGEIK